MIERTKRMAHAGSGLRLFSPSWLSILLFSGHFSFVRTGRLDHCRTSQWKMKLYRLRSGVFCCCCCFFFLEKLSPTSTLVRICGSGRIVWIKCEIPIINVGNHLDGQLWQLQSPLSQVWKDSNIPSPIKTLDHHKSNNINLLNSHRMPCFVKTFILFILFYLPH